MKKLKNTFGLKITSVNNEGRELTKFRISNFKLNEIVNTFVASGFVHLRKPDVNIY